MHKCDCEKICDYAFLVPNIFVLGYFIIYMFGSLEHIFYQCL